MKTMAAWTVMGTLCVGLVLAAAGCQTPGKPVSAQASTACPMCKMETRTAAIKGLTYTKCLCPSCKTVTQGNAQLADTVRNYAGNEIGDTVHVCDHCGAVVENCAVCRKQADR